MLVGCGGLIYHLWHLPRLFWEKKEQSREGRVTGMDGDLNNEGRKLNFLSFSFFFLSSSSRIFFKKSSSEIC